MTYRELDLSGYNHPDERVMAWIEANNLDPNLIPADLPVIINGDKLTVTEFLLEQTVPGAPPHKTMAEDGSGLKKTTRTVPLLSAPEAHGL